MKKSFLTLALIVCSIFISNAQEGFSVQAGISNVSFSTEFEGGSASDSELGFFLGAGYQFSLNDNFDLQPSLLYSAVKDLNALYIPVMVKYNISDKFNVQAGPQVNYLLEDIDDGKLGIDIAAGVGYKISDEFYALARYGFQVSRDIENFDINTLHIGVGYNF